MFCPNCGTNNDAGTLFCENCGTRLEPEAQPFAPQAPVYQQPAYQPAAYQPTPVQKKSKLPLIIIAIIAVIGIAVGCYFAFSADSEASTSAEEAALTYIEGTVENDPDKAVSVIYQKMNGFEHEVRDACETVRSDAEKNDITFDSVNVTNTADASGSIRNMEETLLSDYSADADIDDLKVVTVRIERSSGEYSDHMDIDVTVAKIDGNWYVIGDN